MSLSRIQSGLIRQSKKSVATDSEVMGGVPAFKGSRLPILTVLASIDAGMLIEETIAPPHG
ncbi:TPA: DUF433 domain-containing protein [Pseudomonas aeruginosa]|uniref:DUF433 domain-containing protein n=1 Tax=Pseudomonas aeruginosa TaxID=287 RepID=UPI002D7B7168|nr:DUF433 domain-containing protein [Pseudomonas aeruginosa]HBN9350673.1 DUF433 domain-containing protein [Pseudomonas aeruginosa]HCI2806993.1 DUF433 domain-containing protein [Pseudomonas aeruginosa]HCI4038514.1 DUF433 domain-containing protein [Pseudomonas aeruginosa]HEP9446717.1 DUF433 domain-containing protein [Pseudomonas aeruginosa]